MTNDNITTRRGFLRAAGQGALAAGLAPTGLAEIAPGEQHGDIPRRTLGKTGQKVSMLCIGG
jgi:hypothetical protein